LEKPRDDDTEYARCQGCPQYCPQANTTLRRAPALTPYPQVLGEFVHRIRIASVIAGFEQGQCDGADRRRAGRRAPDIIAAITTALSHARPSGL